MEKDKFLNRIANAYKKAAQFEKVMPLIQEIVNNPEEDLTEYIYYQIFKINEYLHINTVLKKSSQIKKNNQLKMRKIELLIFVKLKKQIFISIRREAENYIIQRILSSRIYNCTF